ncbi:MAG: alpha/beta fold hydrolase [Microbacteriaceae bacterium]|nr:alpha/beta fold hydrolase [Microbacteriaceae bacterium]
MTRRHSRASLALTALVVAATVSLTGCASWFLPARPATTSTPTGEDVAPGLADYYHQVLVWSPCGDGMQCTTAKAPMDWDDPAGESIELALIRQPATGQRLGSLLVNPGGPGGSGYDFIHDSIDYATTERLQGSYDIVGFDPRGVGRSSAVSCYDDPSSLDAFLYDPLPAPVGGDEWIAASTEVNDRFGQDCLEHTGALLEHVDTVSAARDLDLLRAVLGDAKLNYLGYSYGTYLGATYAELYPGNVGRLVIDGALDPSTSDFDVTKTQAVGFESALTAYLTDCVQREGCPFRSVDGARRQIAGLLDAVTASPVTGEDGRVMSAGTLFFAIILPLYSQDTWGYLDLLFDEVIQGETRVAFFLADSYYERNPDGTYTGNTIEANIAINCLDYAGGDPDVAVMRAEAAELAAAAPVFGPRMSYGALSCVDWPFPPAHERGPIHAPGSPDILVLGTTNDPATPYVWAQALADQLEHGHLVTLHGEGHTAYNKFNDCIDGTVDDFFIDGAVPAADPDC